jgi:transcription initiation factor TFIID subunit 10
VVAPSFQRSCVRPHMASAATTAQQPSSGPATPKKNKFLWSEDLNDFLAAVDAYTPTVPDAVSTYYLEKSGLAVKDSRIPKLVSLAADKLLSEIIHEAKQVSILRQQAVKSQKRRAEMDETLELTDLETSLAQYRILLKRKKARSDD